MPRTQKNNILKRYAGQNVLRIEPMASEEVAAADRTRWREWTLKNGIGDEPYETHIQPKDLFSGPDAESAGILLDALYDGFNRKTIVSDTRLSEDGPTPSSVLGSNASEKLKNLQRTLSRRSGLKDGERRYTEDGSVHIVYRIYDNAVVKGDPDARITWLRELPSVLDEDLATVPGVGTYACENVGNTSYTTGLFIYFHPEGEEESLRGHLDYRAFITGDFKFDWKRGIAYPSYYEKSAQEEGWTSEVIAAADPIVRRMPEADPVGWMFQFIGAIEMEKDPWENERRRAERSLCDYREMKDGKRGRRNVMTQEDCDRLIASYERDIAKLDEKAGRMAGIACLKKAISEWIDEGRKGSERRPAAEMMEAATAAAVAACAAATEPSTLEDEAANTPGMG